MVHPVVLYKLYESIYVNKHNKLFFRIRVLFNVQATCFGSIISHLQAYKYRLKYIKCA
jgi:hypothetical protein